jgi:hypothetical protein
VWPSPLVVAPWCCAPPSTSRWAQHNTLFIFLVKTCPAAPAIARTRLPSRPLGLSHRKSPPFPLLLSSSPTFHLQSMERKPPPLMVGHLSPRLPFSSPLSINSIGWSSLSLDELAPLFLLVIFVLAPAPCAHTVELCRAVPSPVPALPTEPR